MMLSWFRRRRQRPEWIATGEWRDRVVEERHGWQRVWKEYEELDFQSGERRWLRHYSYVSEKPEEWFRRVPE